MQYVAFSELSDIDICVSEVLCAEYHWKDRFQNEYPIGRDKNVLSFTECAKKQIFVNDGDAPLFDTNGTTVTFVAAGIPYQSRAFADEASKTGRTICVKFKLMNSAGEELMLTDKYICRQVAEGDNYAYLFRRLIDLYMRARINNLNIKVTLYRILSELCKSVGSEEVSEDYFHDLAPAFKYLATDIGNNLSIAEIAQLCFMSTSYFHKRFKMYTGGETFVEYRNRLRVEKAKELLENPMWSVSMISQSLGFYDSSHFYRVYKKYTGEWPIHIKKMKTNNFWKN